MRCLVVFVIIPGQEVWSVSVAGAVWFVSAGRLQIMVSYPVVKISKFLASVNPLLWNQIIQSISSQIPARTLKKKFNSPVG